MRISLITLHCVNNYGSVLQTYASQKALEKMGHVVEVVDYIRYDQTFVNKLLSHFKYENHTFKGFVKSLIFMPSVIAMQIKFGTFRKRHIHTTLCKYYKDDDFITNPIEADAYVVGSDQVWNSILNKGIVKPYYLSYVPNESKKISYSSSFGVDKLQEEEKNIVGNMLKRFDYITTRELSGVEIVRDLGIENVSQILDPTLLLDGEAWKNIAVACKEKKPYLLVYQLHHQEGLNDYLKEISRTYKLKVIRICYRYDEFRKFGNCVFLPSVEQLLGYIINASYIVTDSFHITAFSINLNKQFESLVPAKQFGGRISSLLKLTGLESRGVSDFEHSCIERTIDYSKVNIILEKTREKDLLLIKRKL